MVYKFVFFCDMLSLDEEGKQGDLMSYQRRRFFNTNDIVDSLNTLDYLCIKNGVVAELVKLGGAGILINMEAEGQEFRSTQDIDVNIVSTNDFDKMYEILREANIHVVGGVMEVPPMEDMMETGAKFELKSNFQAIKVYVPSIELLACAKIFSTREKDLEDLRNTDILDKCNIPKLLQLVDEYKDYVLNPSNMNMNLHELDNILKKKGYNKE